MTGVEPASRQAVRDLSGTGRTDVEHRLDARARRVLEGLPSVGWRGALVEFLAFGLKQAWACLFAAVLLVAVLVTALWWPDDASVARYDALLVLAVVVQVGMLALRLETWGEARVILAFHVVGTVMELFKTSAGSWVYPEDSVLRLGDVPLFSGFMYAAVGSYLARVWRLFDFRFTGYPARRATLVVAAGIYVNFFAHHWTVDVRLGLFALVGLLWWRTSVHFRPWRHRLRMPLLLGFGLVASFIWVAENVATFARVWSYPGQEGGWEPVALAKLGSWFLLMIVSFVLVSCEHQVRTPRATLSPAGAAPPSTSS